MATDQAQQVVVMAPMGQTQTVQPNGGNGEFNTTTGQTQTVVVVQQQPAATTAELPAGDRYPRWAYLIFCIGMFLYHFLWFWYFFALTFVASLIEGGGNYGALFFFCGVLPAMITFIWLINDSTVFCSNPGSGDINKMCCCTCINGYIMAVPIAIAAGLRLILWISLFGILAKALDGAGLGLAIDNVFWMIVSLGCFDVGPLILLAIDWWWYYGKRDFDALFGTKIKPLRCIVGESIVIMIVSWALIAVFEEYADDAASIIWPWILHGIVSTAILVFAAFLQFSGSVTGNLVSNGLFRLVCWGLGAALGVLSLIVWGYFLSWAFGWAGGNAYFAMIMIIYGMYYSGMTVPTIWALFSFQVGTAGDQSAV